MNAALSRLIKDASVIGVDPSPLQRIPGETAATVGAALDRFSLEVANQYANGKMSFELADQIMGDVCGFIISFLTEEKNSFIPEISWSIYLAFDEGEWYHPNDQPREDPVEKYTKPLVSELLRKNQRDT